MSGLCFADTWWRYRAQTDSHDQCEVISQTVLLSHCDYMWLQMLDPLAMPWRLTVLSFLLLLLTCPVALPGNHQLKGPADPVRASVGEDVVLPCSVEPPLDMSTLTVEWSFNKTRVHVYRNRRDDSNLQDKNYRERTSLFKDELVNGNVSLKLSSVQKTDGGNYTCHLPRLSDVDVNKVEVQLIVDNIDPSSPDVEQPAERNSASTQTSVILPLVLALATLLYTCKRKRRRRPTPEHRDH